METSDIDYWYKPHEPKPKREDSPYSNSRRGRTYWLLKDVSHLSKNFVLKYLRCKTFGHREKESDRNIVDLRCTRCGMHKLEDSDDEWI